MHSVMFVATIPTRVTDWREFLTYADQKLDHAENVLRLSENVWLINLQKSVAPLGWLVSKAEQKDIAYGLLPFEHAPEWLPDAFDPSTS